MGDKQENVLLYSDRDFLAVEIARICNFAVKYGCTPDDVLESLATDILTLLEIASFNGWEGEKQDEQLN